MAPEPLFVAGLDLVATHDLLRELFTRFPTAAFLAVAPVKDGYAQQVSVRIGLHGAPLALLGLLAHGRATIVRDLLTTEGPA